MASLLERFMADLQRRAGHVRDWPPKDVESDWLSIEAYRRRFENDRERLIQNNPRWHGNFQDYYEPVPVAYEMARLSSSLLFSEEIGATLPTEGDAENALQGALDEIVEDSDFDEFCHETGEYTANEGIVGVRVVRDEDTSDLPVITWVHGDQVLWDIRHGRYVRGGTVITERILGDGPAGKPVFRLAEEHGKGYVERTLYKGTGTKLGQPVALNSLDEFAELADFEETGLDEPTLVMWKNVPGGRSDLFPILGQLDRIDEAEALLIEKARKSRPWIFSARNLSDKNGVVDISNLIFLEQSEVDQALGTTTSTGAPVVHVQPSMQSEEHIAWSFHLLDLTLMMSGFSLASWGRDTMGGGADSGVALKLRQSRTLLNRAGKERMGKRALTKALGLALAMRENPNATNASVRVRDYVPDLELGDGLPQDDIQTATELQSLSAAEAISTEQKVRTLHPEWDAAAVEQEVAAIEAGKQTATHSSEAKLGATGGAGSRLSDLLGRSDSPPNEQP